MRSSAKLLTLFMGLGVAAATSPGQAGVSPSTVATVLSHASCTQLGGSARQNRRDADRWLELARKAMKQGQLEVAESYLKKAEALKPEYGLRTPLVDTPEKVRRDLEKMRSQGDQDQPQRPSQRALPRTLGELGQPSQSPPRDAFAERSREATLEALTDSSRMAARVSLEKGRAAMRAGNLPAAIYWHGQAKAAGATFASGEYGVDQFAAELRAAGVTEAQLNGVPQGPAAGTVGFPPAGSERGLAERFGPSRPAMSPNSPDHPAASSRVGTPDQAARDDAAFPLAGGTPGRSPAGPGAVTMEQAQGMLLQARRLLARGDLARAEQQVRTVAGMPLDFPLHADTPQKVGEMLRRAPQFAAGPAPGANGGQFNLEYAGFLLEQADQLLRHGDHDTSYMLAMQAKAIPAQYGAFQLTPDAMLQKIAEHRTQQAVSGMGSPAAGRGPAVANISDGPGPRRLPTPGEAAGSGDAEPVASQDIGALVAQGRAALDRGDLGQAKRMVDKAESLPGGATSNSVWELSMRIREADRRGMAGGVQQASFNVAQAGQFGSEPAGGVQRSIYDPGLDGSQVRPAQAVVEAAQLGPPAPAGEGTGAAAQASPAQRLYELGLQALEKQDRQTALKHFREAWQFEAQIDPVLRQQLQDKLNLLTAAAPLATAGEPSPLEAVDNAQNLLRQKLFREITSEQKQAERQSVTDPRGALARLQGLRDRVAQAEVDAASRKQLLTIVDRELGKLEHYIAQNSAAIELSERNAAVRQDLQRDALRTSEIQKELASLIDQFNQLIDEQRFEEAEIVAKKARELDPDADVVRVLTWKSRFARRIMEQMRISEGREAGFYNALTAVEESATPQDDRQPYVFGDARRWQELTESRRRLLERQSGRLTPAGVEIEKALKKKVDVNFTETPLSVVIDTLGRMADVNVHLDRKGLAAEGVNSDTPVTLNLSQPITLKSALTLILQELHLSYVIRNEVLLISNEQAQSTDVYREVYQVADLVVPIPNFIPGYNIGLPAAIREAHNAVGHGLGGFGSGSAPLTIAANEGAGPTSASVLAQMSPTGRLPSTGTRPAQPMAGPGGLGGAALADFDSLIELITTTIAPDTWDEVGGAGAIQPFPGNLSLVISQTQQVHDQIVDLLEQLRKLQDLQVTIEVRFITLNDNFFERIGIGFEFDIDDNVNVDDINDDRGPSVTIGLDQMGPTVDLDLSFTQDSFGASIPQFGNFDGGSAANFGFAILSDIEVFFLLQAAQGDTRSNVLQAPKVTLFNGQQASVSDTSQRPFVTSIIPVVGDFAAAHQPVIVVLSEGTSLSVQAVVSSDRRFVRLTLVPFFSRIGDVQEFTFDGSTTTSTGETVLDPVGNPTNVRDNVTTTTTGTTVQLPTFVFTTVSTTVSVPDGGTVLLGGIKRLSEGRTERGVPMLAQLPYVNRLFKNVGIGRTTQSLMMMVTPRIIIQEEEEEAQTNYRANP